MKLNKENKYFGNVDKSVLKSVTAIGCSFVMATTFSSCGKDYRYVENPDTKVVCIEGNYPFNKMDNLYVLVYEKNNKKGTELVVSNGFNNDIYYEFYSKMQVSAGEKSLKELYGEYELISFKKYIPQYSEVKNTYSIDEIREIMNCINAEFNNENEIVKKKVK